MRTMQLAIQKRGYSRAPWRIGLAHADGRFVEIAHLCFDRKRDAVPVLAALVALQAPWDVPWERWPADMLAAARAIVHQTPGYETWHRAVQRQAAPGRR